MPQGCDLICVYGTLDRHTLTGLFTPCCHNASLTQARDVLDKQHKVIPPTHKCARFSFFFAVVTMNFLAFLAWTFIYMGGIVRFKSDFLNPNTAIEHELTFHSLI